MADIRDVYDLLQSDEEDKFLEGVHNAEQIKNLSLLIMPPAPIWEQCAEILVKKSDEELEPYLIGLLEWLDDLNWPGALTVYERLMTFSGEKLRDPFINCVVRIIREMEYGSRSDRWVKWLAELLDNAELKRELPEDILIFMQKYYHSWGNNIPL